MNSSPRLYYLFHEESAEDTRLVRELENSLYTLYRDDHHTTSWHRVLPGAHVEDEEQRATREADIILVMLSPDFLGCDRCFQRAVEAHIELKRGAAVVPILLRPVALVESDPLPGLQRLPRNNVPVSRWTSTDEAWQHLTNEMKEVIHRHTSRVRPSVAHDDPDASVILAVFNLVSQSAVQPFLDHAADAVLPIFEYRHDTPFLRLLGSSFGTLALVGVCKFDDLLNNTEINWRHSRAIRLGLRALWPKFFGPTRAVRMATVATPSGEIEPEQPYSRNLSITTFMKDQPRLQLLFRDDISRNDFASAVDDFLDLATVVFSGINQELIMSCRSDLRRNGLITYEPRRRRLVLVDTTTLPPESDDTAARCAAIGLLPHQGILRLHRVAVSARLGYKRAELLSGINPQFKASLQTADTLSNQLLFDLVTMNLVGTLRDGTVPLQLWLTSAAALAPNSTDARLFENALLQLGIRRN